VFVDALSDGDEEPAAASGSSNPERPQHPASKQAGRSGGGAAPPVRVPDAPRTAPPGPLSARVAEVQFTTDNYHEFFADEPVAGTTQLPGGGVEPVLPGSLVQGPTVASCLDRHEVKGEDKALNMRGGTWTPAGSSGEPCGGRGCWVGAVPGERLAAALVMSPRERTQRQARSPTAHPPTAHALLHTLQPVRRSLPLASLTATAASPPPRWPARSCSPPSRACWTAARQPAAPAA
jgi:hypothetical protein